MAVAKETNQLTQEYLREVFDYADGSLYWKHDPHQSKRWNAQHAGNRAGNSAPNGYDVICINPNERNGLTKVRNFNLHRLVFCYHYGYHPPQVDHIDGNRGDSRIENLRPALPYQNAANHGGHSKNTTGCLGVRKHRDGHYEARFSFRHKRYQVGSFKTVEEARIALEVARSSVRGEWQRANI